MLLFCGDNEKYLEKSANLPSKLLYQSSMQLM